MNRRCWIVGRVDALAVLLILVSLSAGCEATGGERAEQNIDVVRRMADAINDRDLDALDRLVAADLHRHSGATPDLVVESLDDFKDFLRSDFAAVPDSHQEIELIFATEEFVGMRAVYRGTQQGAWGPFPGNGERVELPFNGLLRMEDGNVAEIWVEWDNLNVLTQLGHWPPGGDSGMQGPGARQAIEDECALLNATEEAWVEAIHAGDRERSFSYWTEDAVIYAAGGTVVEGKPAILDFVRASRDRGTTLRIWREPERTVVSKSGDVGYTIGAHEFRRTGPDGTEVRMPGSYLCAWRKTEDGEWRCVLEIHSSTNGGSAPVPAELPPTPDQGTGVVYVPGTTLFPCEVRAPAGFDPERSHDLVIGLHGFGSSPDKFASISAPFVKAGMLFAAPRAPTPFLVDDRIGFDWDQTHVEQQDRQIEIAFERSAVGYILDVVNELKHRYRVDRVYLMGFSQGGAYAYVVGMHFPEIISGVAVVGMGLSTDWFEEGALEDGSRLPVFIAHSRDDDRVAFDWADSSAETLRALDYEVTMVEYEGGHRITNDVLQAMVQWLQNR